MPSHSLGDGDESREAGVDRRADAIWTLVLREAVALKRVRSNLLNVTGHAEMPAPVDLLRARGQQRGIAVSAEFVAWKDTRAALEL